MSYKIIEPPFEVRVRKMDRPTMKRYKAWFVEQMPLRIKELEKAVGPPWIADYSRDSIVTLGYWFKSAVEWRQTTEEEYEIIARDAPLALYSPGIEIQLTMRTLSLCHDIGMYMGETFVRNVPAARWRQVVRAKTDADYGQMVVDGVMQFQLNTMASIPVAAESIITGKKKWSDLGEMYDKLIEESKSIDN